MVLKIYNPDSDHASCTCRSCGQSGLIPVLSLGETPLANALLTEDQLSEPETHWPLELVRCPECSLVQITETVPPEILFREYAYFSSFSDTMVSHARTIAERLVQEKQLKDDSLVVEIASNDGYLLQWYRQQGVPVLGIEPAENIAEVAIRERDVPTISEFFGQTIAEKLAADGQSADIIHANNVLAHVADLNGVIAGFKAMLKPDGRVVVEAPYLKDLIDHVEFDTIYHEHLCYFSLTALSWLFQHHDLRIVDVEHLDIHGGSLRIFAAHQGAAEVSENVTKMMQEESAWVFDDETHQVFSDRVEELRLSLTSHLQQLKADGHRIAVYGASAKGSTLLNYFGIDSSLIDYVVDRSTVKQGRYTPGTHLQIHDPQQLAADQPDYCLLLTWNFADEILKQQQQYRDNGGQVHHPRSGSSSGLTLMQFVQTELEGALLIRPDRFQDERGFFARTWCEQEFTDRGLNARLVQCNVSFNHVAGTLRGMHWQTEPHGETKLVRCTSGSIYDVIVDVRPQSDTFGRWQGFELNHRNQNVLYIPEGFAHGFITLEPNSEVFYQMSEFYHAELSAGLNWADETLAIQWPCAVDVVSERDQQLPSFKDVFLSNRKAA